MQIIKIKLILLLCLLSYMPAQAQSVGQPSSNVLQTPRQQIIFLGNLYGRTLRSLALRIDFNNFSANDANLSQHFQILQHVVQLSRLAGSILFTPVGIPLIPTFLEHAGLSVFEYKLMIQICIAANEIQDPTTTPVLHPNVVWRRLQEAGEIQRLRTIKNRLGYQPLSRASCAYHAEYLLRSLLTRKGYYRAGQSVQPASATLVVGFEQMLNAAAPGQMQTATPFTLLRHYQLLTTDIASYYTNGQLQPLLFPSHMGVVR